MSKTGRVNSSAHQKVGEKGSSKSGDKASSKKKRAVCKCLICDDDIIDQNEQCEGQDSIFCDGLCQGWLHRRCAGLTKKAFLLCSESSKPFKCPHCQLRTQEKELLELKSVVEVLRVELSKLSHTNACPGSQQSKICRMPRHQ